ncbi:CNNM domain-containing protein [Kordiimonas aestuarii]|uniref:CNNM domain-containing protein n=1 Tax=Kordiimonas aestuarii TaxID=1005925 RepID=UPI0021D29B24|nr:hemolysin family protein [Kordiimonas aestuarii]
MLLLIFYLLLAICVSFLCSVAEAVLLSVRPAYVTALEKKRRKGAKALRQLRENLDRPLAAILILNTIAHTVGAAGVGAQAAQVFGSQYIAVTSAVLTLLILILSEIIPKTLGATFWQGLAPYVAISLLWVMRALYPLVWMSEKLTRLIARRDIHAFTFSRDEMTAMAQIGAEEGLLDEKELKIVRNLMRLHRFQVKDIMSPRAVIFVQPESRTVEDFFADHADNPFSRIPVYEENTDEITGYVLKQDLFIAQARDQFSRTLAEFRRDLPAIPDTITASHAYDRLMRDRSHIMLVVDEYGATRGLLTLEDVVETLVGLEITDELDTETDMQKLARRRWHERMKKLGIDTSEWEQENSA